MPLCNIPMVRIDSLGFPIPGTLQFYPPTNLPCDSRCQYVQLQTTPYIIPSGSTRCSHPDNLRYFYRISNKSGKVVPNSLIESYDHPQPNKDNSGCWLEFVKTCPNS